MADTIKTLEQKAEKEKDPKIKAALESKIKALKSNKEITK